jgi:hypothetical protein
MIVMTHVSVSTNRAQALTVIHTIKAVGVPATTVSVGGPNRVVLIKSASGNGVTQERLEDPPIARCVH